MMGMSFLHENEAEQRRVCCVYETCRMVEGEAEEDLIIRT